MMIDSERVRLIPICGLTTVPLLSRLFLDILGKLGLELWVPSRQSWSLLKDIVDVPGDTGTVEGPVDIV